MKYSITFILICLGHILSFSQVKTIEIELQKRIEQPTLIATSNNNLYCFFSKKRSESIYSLEIFNNQFEKVQSIDSVDLGQRGQIRNFFIQNNNIYKSALFRPSIKKHQFVLFKTMLDTPKKNDYCLIELKKEQFLASDNDENNCYVASLNNDDILKIYTIELKTLQFTEKEFPLGEGTYNYIYNSTTAVIDPVQIKHDKYSDFQAALSPVKSYFQDSNYILSIQGTTRDVLAIVDLKIGSLNGVNISGIVGNHSSTLLGDRYYVSELGKNSLSLKIFELNTGNLLKEVQIQRNDENSGFQSTSVFNNTKKKSIEDFLSQQRKSNSKKGSFAVLAEKNIGQSTILTFGIVIYDSELVSFTTADGKEVSYKRSKKPDYEQNRAKSVYSEQFTFESWIKSDGNIIPYQADADLKSTYHKIYTLIQEYGKKRGVSQLTTFKFNEQWFLSYYDEKERKYFILEVR